MGGSARRTARRQIEKTPQLYGEQRRHPHGHQRILMQRLVLLRARAAHVDLRWRRFSRPTSANCAQRHVLSLTYWPLVTLTCPPCTPYSAALFLAGWSCSIRCVSGTPCASGGTGRPKYSRIVLHSTTNLSRQVRGDGFSSLTAQCRWFGPGSRGCRWPPECADRCAASPFQRLEMADKTAARFDLLRPHRDVRDLVEEWLATAMLRLKIVVSGQRSGWPRHLTIATLAHQSCSPIRKP